MWHPTGRDASPCKDNDSEDARSEQYDEHGIDVMLQQEAANIPGVALTGPNAGTFTLTALNGPLQKKYGGPTVPATLTAAGVHIPNLPANGSVQGVTAFVKALWPVIEAHHAFPGMTQAVFEQGVEVAAEFANAENGNDPAATLKLVLGPAHPTVSNVTGLQSFGSGIEPDYTTSMTLGNAPQRQYTYSAWTQVLTPTTKTQGVLAANWETEGGVLPNGMPAPEWSMVLANVIQVHKVFATWDHSKYEVGNQYYLESQIQLEYMSNGKGSGQWFVADSQAVARSHVVGVYSVQA
ncbi:hypothetical protein [Sulfobacillus thermotolerans]|uniref:hypothetical protein n=1 Tax=Sulfobacillus thermotolerans TaxID=338644 RepID=UPI0033663E5B